jgi:hypothetical protein
MSLNSVKNYKNCFIDSNFDKSEQEINKIALNRNSKFESKITQPNICDVKPFQGVQGKLKLYLDKMKFHFQKTDLKKNGFTENISNPSTAYNSPLRMGYKKRSQEKKYLNNQLDNLKKFSENYGLKKYFDNGK